MHINKISPDILDVDLQAIVGLCGSIVKWPRKEDFITKALPQFTFCEFENYKAVHLATKFLNHKKLCGRMLFVELGSSQFWSLRKAGAKHNQKGFCDIFARTFHLAIPN